MMLQPERFPTQRTHGSLRMDLYGLTPIAAPEQGAYDAIVLAVGHDQFRALGGQGVRAFGKPAASIVYDVKYVLPRDAVDGRL
jgi:UDP-N-acetyl-D-galactosamine dehydrogenase